MIRGAKRGDRVVVLSGFGRWPPRTTSYRKNDSGTWDFALGNAGTVTNVRRRTGVYTWIHVRPDSPSSGDFVFKPGQLVREKRALERLKQETLQD